MYLCRQMQNLVCAMFLYLRLHHQVNYRLRCRLNPLSTILRFTGLSIFTASIRLSYSCFYCCASNPFILCVRAIPLLNLLDQSISGSAHQKKVIINNLLVSTTYAHEIVLTTIIQSRLCGTIDLYNKFSECECRSSFSFYFIFFPVRLLLKSRITIC